jgi:predicted double-glycine peptidase
MLAALAAALSLASSLTIDVPYLPQTDALCGGAAAAMVFRYWGDAHADPQQFASLIERRRGVAGIANDVLVNAIRSRGWRIEPLTNASGPVSSLEALRKRLAAAQPVIVLLADRGDQYHYVVVSGLSDDAVVIHDPSWGPSRTIKVDRFTALWNASHNWAVVILPGDRPLTGNASPAANLAERPPLGTADPCDAAVADAVKEVQARGMSQADTVLGSLRPRCAQSPAFMRELAGFRFVQKKWDESESLARSVLERVPRDEYASSVLGAALFMQERPVAALRAWNAVDQPRLDSIRISGLTHSRYQTIVESIGLRQGVLLTADEFVRAGHRLEDLPDRASSRLSLRPGEDGFASVDVAIAERSGLPRGYADWAATGARAAIEREAAVAIPGGTGHGEVWTASWRWWADRPRVAVGFAAPRFAGLPGVWRVDGSWQAETYLRPDTNDVRESRTRGTLTVSDWIGPRLRYAIRSGVDAWTSARKAALVGASLEQRLLDDRLAIGGDATTWVPIGSDDRNYGFSALAVHARMRTLAPRTWAYDVTAGAVRVGESAPLAEWGGAGEGRARANLLRAHPLLDGGALDVSGNSQFGRTLRYASAEGQRWVGGLPLVRIALAAFVDVAQASRRVIATDGVTQTDVGAGARLRVPGAQGLLRIDVAHGLRDGATALTIGWMY